jgi:hypothetical protein
MPLVSTRISKVPDSESSLQPLRDYYLLVILGRKFNEEAQNAYTSHRVE